jgi:hypothetical protein
MTRADKSVDKRRIGIDDHSCRWYYGVRSILLDDTRLESFTVLAFDKVVGNITRVVQAVEPSYDPTVQRDLVCVFDLAEGEYDST